MKKFLKVIIATLMVAIIAVAFAACNGNEGTQKAELKLNAVRTTGSAKPAGDLGVMYTINGEIVSLYDDGTYEYNLTSGQWADWGGGFVIEESEWRAGTYEVTLEDEYGMTVVLSIPERITKLRYIDVMPDATTFRDTADISTFATEESDGQAELAEFMQSYTTLTIEIDFEKYNMFTIAE